MKLFVIVPAYQAQSTLRETILRIPAGDWEHIRCLAIVEDGSRDRTREISLALAAEFPAIRVLPNGRNLGYGPTVKRGLEEARRSGCEVAAVLHADGQYPPERMVEFAELCVQRKLSLLQGSRHRSGTARQGGMPLYKIVAGKLLVALENRTFGLSLTDYHSGYLFHHRTALDRIPYGALGDSFDFDLQAIACARGLGLSVGEEAIATRYAGEESHLNPVTYGLRVLKVLWRYRMGYFERLGRGGCSS